MDRATLEKALVQAKQHVTLGARHVERQHEIIAALERAGHDSTQARQLLTVFLATQATHICGRDRLLKELRYIARL